MTLIYQGDILRLCTVVPDPRYRFSTRVLSRRDNNKIFIFQIVVDCLPT